VRKTSKSEKKAEDEPAPFFTGRQRVASLVSKTNIPEQALSIEKTDKAILKIEGYLNKESRKGKNQKRFFTENNSYLNYYRSRKAYRAGKIKGTIDLRNATTICVLVRNGHPTRRFAIQTEAEEDNEELCLFLKAKTRQGAKKWVDSLNERRDFWLDPLVRLQKASLIPVLPKEEEDEDDGEGWKDYGLSEDDDDRNTDDDGYHSARSRNSSNDGIDRMVQLGTEASAHSCSSSSDEDDSDDEDSRKSGASSHFLLLADSLPETSEFLDLPHPPASTKFWGKPDLQGLRVRGPSYLRTREKIPVEADSLFECVAVDMFRTNGRLDHICSHPKNRMHQALSRGENLPFTFVVHIQIPGPPFYSFVVYFVAHHPEIVKLLDPDTPDDFQLSDDFPKGLKQLLIMFFRTGSDNFRDTHLKMIPRVVEGPWIVRSAVASKPALIGTKMTNSYYREKRYFELDVNVGTSSLVTTLTQLAASYARLLTVDLAFLLEGKVVETLPELILGMVRCTHSDLTHSVEFS